MRPVSLSGSLKSSKALKVGIAMATPVAKTAAFRASSGVSLLRCFTNGHTDAGLLLYFLKSALRANAVDPYTNGWVNNSAFVGTAPKGFAPLTLTWFDIG
jgi:hypothetical protein